MEFSTNSLCGFEGGLHSQSRRNQTQIKGKATWKLKRLENS